MSSKIKVEITFDEYVVLSDKAGELANSYARIVADGDSSVVEEHRKSYKLWVGIQNAVVRDSEWIDD